MSEKLFFCPLECGARIKSLASHIKKCRNYKLLGVKFTLCEYNPSHIIKNELYEYHLLSCSSKKKSEKESDDDDDDFAKKMDDDGNSSDSSNDKKKEKETEAVTEKKNDVNEDIKEINTCNNVRKKKKYKHENALFATEEEIDKECLDFYHQVYV